MTAALFDVSPSTVSIVLFVGGWMCGWLLLCRPRHLPRPQTPVTRAPLSVVVPVRDEAPVIGTLVRELLAQCDGPDQVIVVDDGSRDASAAEATQAGATVLDAGPLPAGWAGKPHACAVGAAAAEGEILVFVDADVSPHDGLLDEIAAEVGRDPSALVSVQPWHVPGSAVEQLSLMFNIAALMGSGAFSLAGPRARIGVAFGPVLALRRERYEAVGGHGGTRVRSAILEDIALARATGRSRLFIGARRGTTFRMYPGGFRQLVEGWTKGMGIGATAASWWAVAGTAAWMTSVAGGWLASPWFALATVIQLAGLARIAGRFSPVVILLYPIPAALFVVVFGRSVVRRLRRSPVTWRGRDLVPDQDTRGGP